MYSILSANGKPIYISYQYRNIKYNCHFQSSWFSFICSFVDSHWTNSRCENNLILFADPNFSGSRQGGFPKGCPNQLAGNYHLLSYCYCCSQRRPYMRVAFLVKPQPSPSGLPYSPHPGETYGCDGDAEEHKSHHGIVRSLTFT